MENVHNIFLIEVKTGHIKKENKEEKRQKIHLLQDSELEDFRSRTHTQTLRFQTLIVQKYQT